MRRSLKENERHKKERKSAEVKLELGHKATWREKPTTEGFTHNWTVFVKGCEGSNISHFVDKVVFHLHESFPKPKRVVKEPPYQVSEAGYAGFIMPIEVYFRNKEEPKKVCFEYDLFLRVGGQPVHNIRVEKLTFQNPSEDFSRKLLKARSDRLPNSGAVGFPTLPVASIQHSEEPHLPTHTKPVAAIPEKKPRTHTPSKEPAKPSAPVPKPSQPFNDIFGSPIKPKHSPEPTSKPKESAHPNHQKPNKYLPPSTIVSGIVASKDPKQTVKDNQSISEAKPKVPKVEKESKTVSKRFHPTPDGQSQHALPEKKRKHNSSASVSSKPPDPAKVKEEKEKKEKHKSKPGLSNKKEKHKISQGSQHKDSSKSPKRSNSHKPSDSLSHNSDSNDLKGIGAVAGREFKGDDNSGDPASGTSPTTPDETYHSVSPASKHMDDDLISPLSSGDESPQPAKEKSQPTNHNTESNHGFQDESSTKSDSLKSKSTAKMKTSMKKHRGKQNGTSSYDGPLREKPPSNVDLGYHQDLVDLQKKIMSLNDQQQLQRIVDIIEKTGKFHISNSSFHFDLCSLDQNTVRQLKGCLSS